MADALWVVEDGVCVVSKREMTAWVALLSIAFAGTSVAAEPRVHVEVAAAHFVGGWQGKEIGFGGVVAGAFELGLSRRFGLEARLVGGRFLEGDAPSDPSFKHSAGTGIFGGGLGFRAHPFADLSGFWLGSSLGFVRTGGNGRLAFDVRAGWDFRVGSHVQMGPYIGFLQVVQPDADALRPEDGRVALVGLHIGFDEGLAPPKAPPPPVPVVAPPAPVVVVKCTGDCIDPLAPAPLSLPDRCPDEPDDYVGASDADGCPLGEAEVKVVGDEIVLNDRVYFDFGYARVKHRSWPLLKSLAKLILSHPEYVLVRINGHTDEIGSEVWNQKLSEDRAAAVKKKLVEYGVPADRLEAKGFGKTQPRKAGGSDADRQENRRVEFIIERKVKVTTP